MELSSHRSTIITSHQRVGRRLQSGNHSLLLQQVTGQVFAIFVITVAAAEAAVGLGIVIAMFKNKETMNINEIDLMKW